ncbi:MAG: DUF4912 domain-containing protein [Leptolyngbya sp. Prado105]|jgi:phosphate transport system substrate-binding protein|nr:DUF4912 domain-containing protein [Leptolyngbya sp. Prado105]
MVHKKYSSAVGFALLLSATTTAEVQLVRAQQAPTFQLPASVKEGTNIRIDGSSSMAAVNDVLKSRFEQQFKGTQVNVAASGVSEGIKAVVDGNVDLAAIGRPLNEQEKAQGLTAVPVARDKIAILIGADNPFARSMTITQFARMFRGEIKNWSEVGGPSAPVKFIDRPDSSDTREAFKSYPVFRQTNFATGATAEQLTEDSTKAIISRLGNTGISYTTANQTKGLSGAKVVAMHGTQPTDPRYPFSQALYYVYKGEPNDAVKAFLGFATTQAGQKAIEQAGVADAIALGAAKTEPAKKADAKTTDAKADGKADTAEKAATQPDAKSATGAAGTTGTTANPQIGNNQGGSSQAGGGNPLAFLFPGGDTTAQTGGDTGPLGLPNWLWWLLPIASGATLLWMLGRGRRGAADTNATGSFNAPGYAAGDLPERDDTFGAPYVEGGFDPLEGDRTYSANLETPEFNPGLDVNAGTNNFGGDVTQRGRDAFGNLGNLGGAAIAGGAAAAAGAGAAAAAFGNRGKQSRVVLKARSSQELEAFWDIPTDERQAMRQQGGEKLALRLYDVTDIDLETQPAHSVQQFDCDELTQRQRLVIALPDRDYLAEIGYLTPENQWLGLARSTHVRVPATSSPGFLGTVAKAGGAAVAGGAAAAGGAVDSAKSFLSGDHDSATSDSTAEQTAEPSWFQRITNRVGDTASDVAQAGSSAVQSGTNAVTGGASAAAAGATAAGATAAGAGAAAWSFLSGQRGESAPPETNTFVTGETGDSNTFVTGETIAHNLFVTGEAESFTSSIGEGRLVLTPRNSRWAYASWDIPRSLRSQIDRSAGENLVLRLYDVTDLGTQLPTRYEEHDIDDMALSCDVPISEGDRTYVAEIGYVNANQDWTRLARSTPAYVPVN